MVQDKMTPYYQSGVAGVEHRNVDASGDGHPFGDSPKEWEADLRQLIRQVADDLYDSWEATVREYLANAETACLKVESFVDDPSSSPYEDMIVDDSYEGRVVVTWDKSRQKLIIDDNGIGMAGVEVDEVFRYIGRSAARDLGTMSGEFGMGALSFLKFIGIDNSTMIMLSQSRLNGDNAAYLVSLAGVEPIRGSLDEGAYGTKFKLDQKKKDMDIRQAVQKFAEWMRVPVLYKELDENGEEIFNEDWGGMRLYDKYNEEDYMVPFTKEDSFEAYMSPSATSRTLLLSMDIDRNTGKEHGAPYPFDIRLLDESGKIVESSNGNEGLIPVSEAEYEQMLIDARPDSITKPLLSDQDVVVQTAESDGEDVYLVDQEELLNSDTPLPMAKYITDSSDVDKYGPKRVILGPHQGRTVVDQDEWEKLPEGRAAQFVPEDELEPFDVDDKTGDLRLPEPTTDRSSLQSHKKFWEYIEEYFYNQFDSSIESYRSMIRESDDVVAAIQKTDPMTVENVRDDL